MTSHCPPPHLQSLPTPEPVKKFQGLDFRVNSFLFRPLDDFKEVLGFSSDISAKSLAADCVILEVGLSFVGSYSLEGYELELIDILLAASDQIEELLYILDSLQNQIHILI